MKVEFYKSYWGFEDLEPEVFFERARSAGYEGFESPMVFPKDAVRDSGLHYVAQGFCESVEAVKADLAKAEDLGAVLLNLHVGKDFWSEEKASEFLEGACRAIEGSSIPVVFETHRGRLFYSAQSAFRLLNRFPLIRLTADFSHWTCVSESLLFDQQEALDLAMARTLYIHARVGHEEGPQVPDPRDPRWSSHLACFEAWWNRIADFRAEQGADILRVDPEFGPPNYMTVDPRTNEALADLWDVCLWMRERLNETLARP